LAALSPARAGGKLRGGTDEALAFGSGSVMVLLFGSKFPKESVEFVLCIIRELP